MATSTVATNMDTTISLWKLRVSQAVVVQVLKLKGLQSFLLSSPLVTLNAGYYSYANYKFHLFRIISYLTVYVCIFICLRNIF